MADTPGLRQVVRIGEGSATVTHEDWGAELAARQAESDANIPGTGSQWLANQATQVADQQQGALSLLQSDPSPHGRAIRALPVSIAINTVQEFNVLIDFCQKLLAAINNATNLATLQAATKAMIVPQKITAQDAINAIKSDLPTQIGNNV